MKHWNVIGLMSGTSLDGLDISFCRFTLDNGQWSYEIPAARTVSYTGEWRQKLESAYHSKASDLARLHMEFGHFMGREVSSFIAEHNIDAQFVSSHGHTVFHDPANGYTFQLGSGAALAAACKRPVVSDLRSLDVALGGQGAPLVPIGDKLLFSQYDQCLNLGGFANISYDVDGKRIAFDICPANIAANAIANETGKAYDEGGALGRGGTVIGNLLYELNELAYYKLPQHAPKSLGKEWLDKEFMPVMNKYSLPPADRLATLYEHIALQTGKLASSGRMLATGGGAFNTYLLERIRHYSKAEIIVPARNIVEFKEALVFAFLGVLRMEGKVNALRDVTGAACDSIGGCIYLHK